MNKKACIALILAGGKGTRLGSLTNHCAKPVVNFGSKYRIIDFTLSNCSHSGIDTLGVLTQYLPTELHYYIGSGKPWLLNKPGGGVYMLPSNESKTPYKGTADAVYQNMGFVGCFEPENVLILSGDHIYKMDYRKMLDFHVETNADATVAVVSVPWEEASRFGIMSTEESGRVVEFAEKPDKPNSNLASMGIYIFKRGCLEKHLKYDSSDQESENDFGKNILPAVLASGDRLFAYKFDGYWRDVGTVQSLWESNMELFRNPPSIDLYDKTWEIYTKSEPGQPCYISERAGVRNCVIAKGCAVYGKAADSVLCGGVYISEGASVSGSVLMPGVFIGRNARVHKALIGAGAIIGEKAEIGANEGMSVFCDGKICSGDISLVAPGITVSGNIKIMKNSNVESDLIPREIKKPGLRLDSAVLQALNRR